MVLGERKAKPKRKNKMNLEDMKKLAEGRGVKTVRMFDDKESAEIRKHYDICAAIRSLMRDQSVDAGFEREIDAEINRRDKNAPSSAFGIRVPYAALSGARTLGVSDAEGIEGSGAALVSTDHRPDLFISPLEAKCILAKSGALILDGLVGDISIPKSSGVEAYWVATEGAPVEDAEPEFTSVKGTPHTLGAKCDLTRKLVLQSSPSAKKIITDSIMSAVSRGVDKAGLAGTGTSGQPLGLLNTNGKKVISGITKGAPTKKNIEDFIAALDDENVDADKLRFLCPAAVKGCLASTLDYTPIKNADEEIVAAASAARYLYEKGLCNDIPLTFSNLCPAKKLILGDWSQMMICGWGDSLSLTVDPYSLSTSGGVRVVVMKDVDILIRHAEAFAVGDILA